MKKLFIALFVAFLLTGALLAQPYMRMKKPAASALLAVGTTVFAFDGATLPAVGETATELLDLGPNGYDMSAMTAGYDVVAAGAGKAIDIDNNVAAGGSQGFQAPGWPARTFTDENWMIGIAFKKAAGDCTWISLGDEVFGNSRFTWFWTSSGTRFQAWAAGALTGDSGTGAYSVDTWTTGIIFVDTTAKTVRFYSNGSEYSTADSLAVVDWFGGTANDVISLGDYGASQVAGAFVATDVTTDDVAAAHAALAALYAE